MLLTSNEFSTDLLDSVNASKKTLIILSAFIKTEAVQRLLKGVADCVDVEVVARWNKRDLLCSASDLDLYEYCKGRGWKFGIDLNLHGKLFIVDESDIYIGSANLTRRGLSLGLIGNNEFGTKISAQQSDLEKVKSFIESEVTWLTDELFEKMKVDVESSESKFSSVEGVWSDELFSEIQKPVEYLWVSELPFSTPFNMKSLDLNDRGSAHDFSLFNFDFDEMDDKSLRVKFRRSRVYKWVVGQLKENGEMNFGAFSKALHDALLDDPSPYRKNVKEFVANIFEWVYFMPEEFSVTKYSRTTSVKRMDPK